jgi:hypothetical protein
MLAGLDTSVLVDVRILRFEGILLEVLAGDGWTTSFVNQAFSDPVDEGERGVERTFPFLEVDPVDARLLSRIERDQVAIAGLRKASLGAAAGEASLVHVAHENRAGSILLSNDPCTVALGRRRGVSVRGTLYLMHQACRAGLLTAADAWEYHAGLEYSGRRPPRLTRDQLDEYLQTGRDPR